MLNMSNDDFCSNGWTCMVQVPVSGKLGILASPAKKNFGKSKLTLDANSWWIQALHTKCSIFGVLGTGFQIRLFNPMSKIGDFY